MMKTQYRVNFKSVLGVHLPTRTTETKVSQNFAGVIKLRWDRSEVERVLTPYDRRPHEKRELWTQTHRGRAA